MKKGENRSASIVEFIREKVNVLNLTVLLSMSVVILLVGRLLYSHCQFMTTQSVALVLGAVGLLCTTIFYITKNVSTKAIETIEDYHVKLEALKDICKQVHEIEHTDVIMEHILESAIEITGAEGGSILTEQEDMLRFDLVRGENAEELTGKTMPRNKGIAGWVIDNGKSAVINNVKNDIRQYDEIDQKTGFGTGSLLCAPIRLKDKVVGAVEIVSSKTGAFSNEDGELMECFLTQAAMSMAGSRYREKMRNFEIHLTNTLMEAIENISGKKGHLKRVAKYSLIIGHALKMNEEGLRTLHRAALLHDIGLLRMKINGVMPENKYNSHAMHGYEILKNITFFKDIAPIVLHHHERFDGTGQPEGLSGHDIPLMSRIISVAEMFDVMTNRGSYNPSMDTENEQRMPGTLEYTKALIELKSNAGSQYDPDIVNMLVNNITESDVEWSAFETRIFDRDNSQGRMVA